MPKKSKQTVSNNLNADDKKKAFREGEMDNSVKLDEGSDGNEPVQEIFLHADGKPDDNARKDIKDLKK